MGTYSEKTEKNYQHFTKDVYCKVCSTKLGVFYEFVPNETIRYLEGKIILEKSAIKQEESKKRQEALPKNSTEDRTENNTDNSTENRTEQQHRESEQKNSDSESDSEGDSESDFESDSEKDSEKDSESEEEGVDEVG